MGVSKYCSWRGTYPCTFFLISQNIYIKKAQRGATQRTQEVYKGKPKGRKRSEKENQGN
jgi:hypothetical protein